MARKPRSGPSGHWSAIGPSDNGDGYVSAEREAAFAGTGKVWGVMRKAPKGSPLHPLDERANRSEEEQETIRGIVCSEEHPRPCPAR